MERLLCLMVAVKAAAAEATAVAIKVAMAAVTAVAVQLVVLHHREIWMMKFRSNQI